MLSDTPFLEYLIIGAHTSTWLVVLGMYVYGIQPASVTQVPTGLVVVLVPFVYLIGMLFDSLVQILYMDRVRRWIKHRIEGADCPDELIAFESGRLYKGYDARVQRVRIIGAAIPNWIMLAGLLIVYGDFVDSRRGLFTEQNYLIASTGGALALVSLIAMFYLYARAFRYRSKACFIINTRSQGGTRQVPTP
jgi:hypothetical protein